MKKAKILVLSLMLMVATVTAAGCTQLETDEEEVEEESLLSESDPITITFWHYYGDYVQEKLNIIVDEFNETKGAQYGVTVELVAKPSIADLEVELSESAQGVVYADEMPSMFLAYPDKILELQELGIISNLDEYMTEEEQELIIDSFLESGILNEEQAMFPVVKSTELIFINETYWNTFASATGYTDEDLLTWEGLMEVAKSYYDYTDALTPDISNDGKALFGMDSLQNFITVGSMQMGVDMFYDEDDLAILDEEILETIFNYYVEGVSMGYFDSVGKFRTDDMRSGDIIAFAGSSASFVYVPEWIEVDGQQEDITWKSLPYPYFESGEPYVLSQGAGIAVSKISDQQQEACVLFLNYFLDYNVDFALDSAYVPVTTEFLEFDSEERLELFQEYGLEENEVATYELVMEQIADEQLYQQDAFDGSYTFRTEIADVFEQAATNIRVIVDAKLDEGVAREGVLEEVDLEEQFETTLTLLEETLTSKGVSYRYN